MPALLGLFTLIVVLSLLKLLVQANPKDVIKVGRTAGGIVALAGAAFLGVRGELQVALPLGVTGLGLLGFVPKSVFGLQSSRRSPGQTSHVQSNFLDLTLDHETGALSGTVTAGRFKGAELDQLELSNLLELLDQVDAQSRDLLAAYLDRRDPRWRDHVQGDAAARNGGARRSSQMTEEEAYQVLGLEPGASADDIGHAHRRLMKKLHPDQGGSTYLASRVNEAKDVLLRRH
jgi:hypothetical protein